MSALDEIKKQTQKTQLDAAVIFYDSNTAAAELLKLREEIQILKALLYESKQINALVNSEGGGAWGMVKDDLDERIDEVLNGFTPDAN